MHDELNWSGSASTNGTAASTTVLIRQLKSSDRATREVAADLIWKRFAPRLLARAHQRMDTGVRQRESAEDVLQSVFKSFYLRQRRGDFDLKGSDDLWTVLLTILHRKVVNTVRRHQRDRRDCRRDYRTEPSGNDEDQAGEERLSLSGLPADCLAPDELLLLREELERRLKVLPEALRAIAIWKLEGYTNEEIASPSMLNCAVRTVERKLARIRRCWQDGKTSSEE